MVEPIRIANAVSTLPQGLLVTAMANAAAASAAALSEMACRLITAGEVGLRTVPLAHLSMVAGDPERPVVAIYLGIQGDVQGHIVMALSEPMARGLVDMLLDQEEGSTSELGDMEVSALAEAGNVGGTYFLTSLAESTGLTLPPTPPIVFYEMCGAVLNTLAAELAMQEQEEAMVVDTQFTCDGQVVEVAFFMFPAPEMARALADRENQEVAYAGSRD
jgi:chemotaxis protein CheC